MRVLMGGANAVQPNSTMVAAAHTYLIRHGAAPHEMENRNDKSATPNNWLKSGVK